MKRFICTVADKYGTIGTREVVASCAVEAMEILQKLGFKVQGVRRYTGVTETRDNVVYVNFRQRRKVA